MKEKVLCQRNYHIIELTIVLWKIENSQKCTEYAVWKWGSIRGERINEANKEQSKNTRVIIDNNETKDLNEQMLKIIEFGLEKKEMSAMKHEIPDNNSKIHVKHV